MQYQVVHGEDWSLISGLEDGITQIARGGRAPVTIGGDRLVWNFPLDLAYKSTNVFGWPQIVISVYGSDAWGRDQILGYGCAHLPTQPGRHALRVRLFRPLASSGLQGFIGWIMGKTPEFSDPKFPAYGEGREVTRVESGGHVVLKLNMLTKGLEAFGYENGV